MQIKESIATKQLLISTHTLLIQFAEWRHERKATKPFLDFIDAELNEDLRKFYAEARNKKGE